MDGKRVFWVHPASFTYRLDEPKDLMETIWAERPGWGYLRRRDLWIKKESTLEELLHAGYQPILYESDNRVVICPSCGMYMFSIPGSLRNKHINECSGAGEDWRTLEDAVIQDVRMKNYEAKILEEKLRQQAELEEMERRERQEKLKEELFARQQQKDRKKRLKQDTKEEFRRR